MPSRLMRTVGFLLLSAFVVLNPSLGHAEDAPSWETVLEAERLRLVSDAIQRLNPGSSREYAIARLRAQGLLPRWIKDSLLLRVLDEWTFKVGVGASVRNEFRRGDRLGDLHAYTGALVRVQLLFDDRGVIKGKSWAVGSDVAVVMPHHVTPKLADGLVALKDPPSTIAIPAWMEGRRPRPGEEADFVKTAKALDVLDHAVIAGRGLDVSPPARTRIARDQVVLSWLLSVQHPAAALIKLSQHAHPRVRTLALVALHHSARPQSIPAIGRLIEDQAPTFGRRAYWSLTGVDEAHIRTLPLVRTTVGEIAVKCLDGWLHRSGHFIDRRDWSTYWKQRKHRSHCVGWMALRLYRVLYWNPIPESQYPKIRALYKEALSLPGVDRDLTILAVFSKSDVSQIVGRKQVLDAGPRLGLENLRALARGELITDDPDFQPDANGGTSDHQARVRGLILQNAESWLRPSDADLVLALGEAMRSPLGAVKAGQLAPERAKTLLESAWERAATGAFKEPKKRFEILKGMWEQLDDTKDRLIVDWYHSEYEPEPSGDTPIHDVAPYLLARGEKRDLRLLKKIILDERFKRTKHELTIIYLVVALNRFLDTALGGGEPGRDPRVRRREAHWHDVLRKTMRTHPAFRDL